MIAGLAMKGFQLRLYIFVVAALILVELVYREKIDGESRQIPKKRVAEMESGMNAGGIGDESRSDSGDSPTESVPLGVSLSA